MKSRNEFYVYLSSNTNNIEFLSNKNTSFTNNIKPTLHLQDEFDVALENIIFELKIISIETVDKNYGIQLTARFTNNYGIYPLGYKITYVPQNDIHGGTVAMLIYNLNTDLSHFLRILSVVESKQDNISCI